MSINFQEILKELEYRVEHGIIDLTKEEQVTKLVEILRENGISDANEMAQKARVYFSYINENDVVKNKKTGNVYVVKNFDPEKHDKPSPAEINKAKAANGGKLPTSDKPTAAPVKGKPTPQSPTSSIDFKSGAEKRIEKPTKNGNVKQRIINGRDKTLAKVDTLHSKAFVEKSKPDAKGFEAKNKKFSIVPPYKLPKEILQNVKVPPRHLEELQRMVNTKFSGETAKWSHFSDLPGGAGQISAQAGELMTMVGTTLDDKNAAIFYNSLLKHEQLQIQKNPKLANEKDRIVTKSWIAAAMNNRKAIRNRLTKEYPGATIEAGAWDTQGEVEAMGLKDYKKNKGFSSDAYFKIKTKDGQQILDEVSLKKSTAVNFLNSGTGKLLEWDPNLPNDINPNVYQGQERKDLFKFGTSNMRRLQNVAAKNKEVQSIMKSKKMDLKMALEKLKAGKGSRDTNKIVMSCIQAAAANGDKASQQYLELVQKKHKKHQQAVISALGTNKKLKEGMLSAIREEFPLKAVGDGEESMAIGPNSLDRAILTNIFNTSDFDQIKQGLVAMTGEEPPYLAYRAGSKGKIIPIATIVAREDGVGYGGQIKFEMQLDRRFAKILEQANKEIYG
jgi:hypothetical protein